MANNKKTMTMEYQLKQSGAVVENKDFNDLGSFSPKLAKLKMFFQDLDSQQFCNRYKWTGFPKYMYMWRVEQMLYNRGSLLFFKSGNRFFLLPYAMSKELTPNGLPTGATPTTYNGGVLKAGEKEREFTAELPVRFDGSYDNNAAGVILYDRINGFVNAGGVVSRFVLQDAIIDELVDRFKYLKINIRNSQGKLLILVKDAKQAETIRKAINDLYDSPDNTDIVTSMYDIQVINNDIKFQGQEIWEDIQSWNNLRLEGLGISNSGLFNKKERTIEKEISNTGTSTDAILQQGLDSRKLFIRQIKELFADDEDFKRDFSNINVELNQDNEDLKPMMYDGENMEESGVNDNVE